MSQNQIIDDLNSKYGDDLLNFERCHQIRTDLLQEKKRLESELNIDNDQSLLISQTVKQSDSIVESADKSVGESKDLLKEIEVNLDELDELRKNVQSHFDKLHSLETTLQYMKVVQKIELWCVELQREVHKKDDEQCATIYANLCEISRNLAGSKARNLRQYLKDTIQHWHKVLKEKLSKDFDDILKLVKWPFVSANFTLQTTPATPTAMQKFQIIVEYLMQIELPGECAEVAVTTAVLADFPLICLPVTLLVQPLRKRFIYHFYGTRQTNRVDKPEWFFTQILTWIRDHADFVVKWVQPVVDKLGCHHIDAKLEFMRGLIQLAVEKLHSDLPTLQFDDFTFSHLIDESLGFDKELRESYDYPRNQPGIFTVLTQASVITKWLAMEKKYATEKMDTMLSDAEAFDLLASDINDLKIPTCADAFITLLQTITERYESLPQPGHRLQFLDLQLELLDDFRIRLLQLVHMEQGDCVESKIPIIANTLYNIQNVLIDWGATLHFLNLFHYRSQLENVHIVNPQLNVDFDTDTVFVDTLSLYRHMMNDLLYLLNEFILYEIKSKSKNYRRENWSSMIVHKDFRSLSLTATACPIFEVLSKRLHQLQKTLTNKLFTIIWRTVAQQLDTFLFDELILANRFNDGGSLQLKYDLTRNLLPLFAQYTDKPECYFNQLIESSNLLNVAKGSALLLLETLLALEGATGAEDTRGKALREIGVNFTPKMAVRVLNQRTDIAVNRMIID